jgi:hypothetical protein
VNAFRSGPGLVCERDGAFVWNFEFDDWNLFEFWFLVLGIFIIFIKQVYFEISFNYLFK